MPVPRLFVTEQLRAGITGRLNPEQTRQIRTVLRLGTGFRMLLFDGSGVEATARLMSLSAAGAEYEVENVERPERELSIRLTVALALLRGERFDLAVQKLTEIGVARIVPLTAERSMVSFNDLRAWDKRRLRFQRVAREAAEQAERVTLPEIGNPTRLEAFLSSEPAIVLVERSDAALLAGLPLAEHLALAVGPEGGWSGHERAAIERYAAGTASLGTLILRAETAAIVAAGTLMQRAWAQGM